jgi:ABC-type phosphate/phosphonate transport system substrate-binding protein
MQGEESGMRHGRLLAGAAILLCLLPSAAGVLAAPLPSLSLGFTMGVLADVDPNDAKAATKVWADMIMRRKGSKVESNAIIFNDLTSLEAAIAEKSIDVVFLLPQQFLEIRDRLPLVPAVSPASQGSVFDEFLLLIRKDSPGRTLSDLRNRRLTVETDQKGTLPLIWLETLLRKEIGIKDVKDFFSTIKVTRKPSQTVLPVFFRQADACVITRNAFNTMVELNPQLGKELQPMAVSPPLLASVGCVRQDYYDKHYPDLWENLEILHKDPQGRQILTLFRRNMLVPYEKSHIRSVEVLLREHDNILRKVVRRP